MFTQGLHRSLQQNPGHVAIIDGGQETTFAELVDRVSRLAGGLASLGVAQGDRVGILSVNRGEYVEYAMACAWLGAVASPVNSRWSSYEIAFQIKHAEIGVLLVDDPRKSLALRLRDECGTLRTVVCLGGSYRSGEPTTRELPAGQVVYEALIAGSEPVPDAQPDPHALALLMYTGGTTGEPKGVMISEAQVMASALGGLATLAFSPPGQWRDLYVAPLFHMAAYSQLIQAVIRGATHVFAANLDADSLVKVIESERITATSLVPTVVARILEHAANVGADLSSLRQVSYGAAPMSEKLIARLRDMLPEVQLRQGYGMTELAPLATILRDADHRDPDHPERLRSVGRAALHSNVRIVDSADLEVPTGTIGEIVVSGMNVMLGYWRDEALTRQTLRGGVMHTGDMGYMDEHGYLFVVDRSKDVIVSGGENVYSAEVERVAILHEAVSACAVIGLPDPEWGERVHAVVVLAPGAALEPQDLRDFVGERIARYKAPRSVDFVTALPVSAVGKVLKRELRDSYVR